MSEDEKGKEVMTNRFESEERAEAEPGSYKHSNGKDDEVIADLGSLSPFDFERQRLDLASQLGIRLSVLDKHYEEQRRRLKKSEAADAFMEPVEPWDRPVDGAELLDDLAETFDRYVLLPNGGSESAPFGLSTLTPMTAFRYRRT